MHQPALPLQWVRPALFTVATLLFACADTGGGGCGGCGGAGEGAEPYVFEGTVEDHVVLQGAQVHVSQRGFDFLAGNLGGLAAELIGGGELGAAGIPICVPPTDVALGIGICDDGRECSPGEPGCLLTIDFACRLCDTSAECPETAVCDGGVCLPEGSDTCIPAIDLAPLPGDPSDLLRATINLSLDETLRTTSAIEDCNLNLRSAPGGFPVSANVYFDVGGPPHERISARLPSEELSFNIDNLDISLTDGFLCGVGDFVLPLVTGLLDDFITQPISDAIEPLLCTACDDATPCPDGSSCQDGVCRYDGADGECVPLALGLETEINIGDLLADIAPGSDARLGLMAYLANYADGNGPRSADLEYYGLDLALETGFYAERDTCVPFVPPPDTSRVPKSRAINAALTPSGDPFAVGIGLAQSALDLAGWAAYNSGTLCLSVGTDFVEQIATGTFGLLIPSLGDLVDGDNREMSITLRPQQPPTFELGAGTVTEDGDIDDPLITLRLDNLELDFYADVADRPVRVMTLIVDVAVPLGLDVSDNNEILVILGDLGSAFTRVEAANADLLAEEDVAQISELLPGLIGALLPALGGDLIPPIAIPDLQGITIRVPQGGFTSVEDGTMLAIFADLAIAETPAEKAMDALIPMLASHDVSWPIEPAAVRAARERGEVVTIEQLTPSVELALDVPNAGPEGYEWSYRLDDGMWSTWRSGETTTLRDARLVLDGSWELDVRVREPGQTDSVSPNLAATRLTIDRRPPRLTVEEVAGRLRVEVLDTSDVDVRARIGDRDWFVVQDGELPAPGAERVEVVATDARGQEARFVREPLVREAPSALHADSAPQASADEPAGCASAGGGASPLWLALLGLLLVRRRRAVALPSVLLAATLIAGCGSKDASGEAEACDPACAEGEICEDGACVPDAVTGCEEDADCGEGEVCEEGACVSTGCADDADCPGGLICEDGACLDPGCADDTDCAEGQICDEGACIEVEECAPEDCACEAGEVATCVDNACVCEPACGGACGDGEGCCFESQECVEIDVECTAADCGPGFEVAPLGDPVWDPATCEATIECDCQELPPLALGEVGELMDLGVSPDGSVTAVATYNKDYGDLMVGLVEGSTIAWSFVDGVPADGDIRGSVNGPRGGIRDDGDDFGRYASIEVDAAGGLHVAYYARNGEAPRSLKYAYGAPDAGSYTWTTMVLDGAEEDVGYFTDLVLDDAGLPVIGYVVPLLESDGTYTSEVRVIAAQASPPASATDFGAPEVLASVALTAPCADSCTSRERCRADTNTCARTAGDDDCGGCAAEEACFENEDGAFVCSAFTSPSAIDAVINAAGVFLDMEWLGAGRVAAAWYSSDTGDLHYLEGTLGDFASSEVVLVDGGVVDDAGVRTDTSDAGWFPDLFVDSTGERWIAYADRTFAELRVAAIDGGSIVTVDDGFRCYETLTEDPSLCVRPIASRVGDDAAITEQDGALSVVFQDATFLEVMESPRVGTAWDIGASIAGNGAPRPGGLGFYLVHGVDDEGRFVLSQRYDVRSEEPARDVIVIRR